MKEKKVRKAVESATAKGKVTFKEVKNGMSAAVGKQSQAKHNISKPRKTIPNRMSIPEQLQLLHPHNKV